MQCNLVVLQAVFRSSRIVQDVCIPNEIGHRNVLISFCNSSIVFMMVEDIEKANDREG